MTDADAEQASMQQFAELNDVGEELVITRNKYQELLCRMSELCAILDEKESEIQNCLVKMENQNQRTQELEAVIRTHQHKLEAEISRCDVVINQQNVDLLEKNKELSQHYDQISELRDSLAALEAGIDSRDTALIKMNKDIEVKDNALEACHNTMASLQSQLASLTEAMQSRNVEHADMLAKMSQVAADVVAKEELLSSCASRREELELEVAAGTARQKVLEEEAVGARSQIDHLESRVATLQADSMKTEDDLSRCNTDAEELRNSLCALQEQIASQGEEVIGGRTALEEAANEIISLQEKLTDRNAVIERMKEEMDSVQLLLKAYDDDTRRGREVSSSLESEVAVRDAKIAELTGELSELQSKLTNCSEYMLARDNDTTRLHGEVSSLQDSLTTSTAQAADKINSLLVQLKEKDESIAYNYSRIKQLEDDLSLLQSAAAETDKMLACYDADANRMTFEIEAVQLELSRSKELLSDRSSELKKSEEQVAALMVLCGEKERLLTAGHEDIEQVRVALSATTADLQRVSIDMATSQGETASLRDAKVRVEEKLQSILQARDELILTHQSDVARLNDEVASLRAELTLRDNDITRLMHELSEWENKDLVLEIDMLKRTIIQREDDLIACRNFHAASLVALKGELLTLTKQRDHPPWSPPRGCKRFTGAASSNYQPAGSVADMEKTGESLIYSSEGSSGDDAPTTPPPPPVKSTPLPGPAPATTPRNKSDTGDCAVLQRVKDIEMKVATSPRQIPQPTVLDSLAVMHTCNVSSDRTPGRDMKANRPPQTTNESTTAHALSYITRENMGESMEELVTVHAHLLHSGIDISDLHAEIQRRDTDIITWKMQAQRLAEELHSRDAEVQRLRRELTILRSIGIDMSERTESEDECRSEESKRAIAEKCQSAIGISSAKQLDMSLLVAAATADKSEPLDSLPMLPHVGQETNDSPPINYGDALEPEEWKKKCSALELQVHTLLHAKKDLLDLLRGNSRATEVSTSLEPVTVLGGTELETSGTGEMDEDSGGNLPAYNFSRDDGVVIDSSSALAPGAVASE